ncbi:hypothetical protein MK079_03795 [Candidatus Gracilibacteria bacterium]|nr:hypothetical protein [Candidatus Gracilibacteria bacterium]
MIIVKILYGILLAVGGYLIVRHRRVVKSWTGNFSWAEKYIGNGGTYFVINIIGIGMIFFGVIYPFGGIDVIIGG